MITTTLSSKGRFKKLLTGMLRKNLSLSIYIGAIMFLFFPLQMIMDTSKTLDRIQFITDKSYVASDLITGMYTGVSVVAVVGILTVGAFAVGLIQCSYMHSKRAVDLYHSLPVTRAQLMSANMLTAFLTVMVPFWANYIINLVVVFYRNYKLGSFAQAVSAYAVFWDVFGWCVAIFSILAVVMLVSTQVGSVFENFIFAGELLVAPIAILGINQLLFYGFLVGYAGNSFYKYMLVSSPASLMVGLYPELTGNSGNSHFYVIATVVWLLLGIAIFFGAMVLGRRRKSEIAEQPGCKGVLGTVLTLVAVYIGGLAIGTVLYGATDASGDASFILSVFVGAVLAFFFVEAILNRGFAGILKTLPFGAVCCAFVVASTFAVTSGGLGYETRVPATDRVEQVTFDYRGWYDYVNELDASTKVDYGKRYGETAPRYSYHSLNQVELKTPEAIDLIKQIHLSMVDDALSEDSMYFSGNSKLIQYNLGSSELLRQYHSYSENTRVLLQQLNELPEFQEQTNPVLRIKSETIQTLELYDSLGFIQHSVGISQSMGELLEAMRKDALANGTRDFTAGSPVLAYIYVYTGETYENRDLTENLITNFSVPVFASSTNTIAALNAMGKGDVLLPADISQVTEVCVNRYSNYGANDIQVAGIGTFASDKENSNYVITDLSDVQRLLDEGKRFGDIRDNSNYDYAWVYLTFFKDKAEGITVKLSPDKLPDEVKAVFPDVIERYEESFQMEDAAAIGIIG